MALDAVLQRFMEASPVSVMARLALQRAVSAEWMDALFEQHRERQYTRELLFSTVIELMSLVAVGLRPSLHAAAKASQDLPVSMAALYEKVNHTEPALVAALVRGSAERLVPVVKPLNGEVDAWVPGYRVRVVDGNHLPASEKRLKPLRGFRGAALPGHSLVVYEPEVGLVMDLVPCEDAHQQERTLFSALADSAGPGELWLADRNFCTSSILLSLAQKQAAFLIREHGAHPCPKEVSPMKRRGRVETGVVFEQTVEVEDGQGRRLALRRIELQLDAPTEDGETRIRLLTNLSKAHLDARDVARLYRRRWTVENLFQRLESVLHSEVHSLGHPRAALLAFGVAVMAYNVLATLQRAIEAEHPRAADENEEVSSYFLASEVKATYGGMMIAVPPQAWTPFEAQSPSQLAASLRKLAAQVDPQRLRKHSRAPKKKVKKGYAPGHVARRHVSTARVLASGRVDEAP
jgi:IS4 transposase